LGPIGVVIVEKIAAASGAVTKPIGTIVNAWAEVQAGKIKAVGEVEIQAVKSRAIERLLYEQVSDQKNLESIYGKTYRLLESDPEVNPETIQLMDNDWVRFHSDRARLVSDDQMQFLWAKIFAEVGFAKTMPEFRTITSYDQPRITGSTRPCSNASPRRASGKSSRDGSYQYWYDLAGGRKYWRMDNDLAKSVVINRARA
jgi:hypothetical protein